LVKRIWYQDYTTALSNSLLSGGSLFAALDSLNYYLQSAQFTSLLSYAQVPKAVYITIAAIGMLVFIAKPRNA
jgi:hypothetical protein